MAAIELTAGDEELTETIAFLLGVSEYDVTFLEVNALFYFLAAQVKDAGVSRTVEISNELGRARVF